MSVRRPASRRGLAALVAAGIATAIAATAPTAGATFQGENGSIAFASNRSGQTRIVVADPNGQNRVDLNAPGTSPRWSPDGTRIAFGSGRDGNSEIYVMNADGTGQTRLTFNPGYDSRPQWTADGKHIVFTRILPPFNWEIFEMNADGSQQVDLTNSDALEWGQATSPHGSKVVFTREDAGIGHLYIMSTNGNAVKQVTNTSSYDSYPNWSPSGNQILFQRESGHGSDLWVVNSDGTGSTQITHQSTTGYILNGSWSPDGTKIIYTRCALDGNNPCALHVMNMDGSGDVDISTPQVPYLDTFSGNAVDPFWGMPFVTGGGGVSIAETNGQLEVSVPSTATLDPSFGFISVGVSAQCHLVGDFDVQVDYRLLNWPSPSAANVDFDTFSTDFSDVHGMFVFDPGGGTGISTHFPGPINTFVQAPETSGTLRLQRVGTTLTAYRLTSGGWAPLQTTDDTLNDQLVNLNVFSNTLSHPDVKVAYDNFRISSGGLACPSWWSDSNADWQAR